MAGPQAGPKPFQGTVGLAQMILKAEQVMKFELGIDFSHVDIDWECKEEEAPAGTKSAPNKTKTVKTYAPFIAGYHGVDGDGNPESYKPAQFERITGTKSDDKSNVTDINQVAAS